MGTDDSQVVDSLNAQEQAYAIRTWRYLRLAMVGVVVALFAAIIAEYLTESRCFQGSISAYYYTPVHGFLIGALVTMGVCLYCLKGNNPLENVLLNLAGMFAPVIALVPTDPPGSCQSASIVVDRYPHAGNNMFALIILESLGLVALWVFAKYSAKQPTKAERIGFVFGVLVVAVEWILWFVFLANGFGFKKWVHYSAAILMFVFIFLVVVASAASIEPGHTFRWHVRHPNRYALIAILMAVNTLLFVFLEFGLNWRYAVFQIEASLILLFVAFWIGQTWDSWHLGEGERPVPEPFRGLV